MLQASMRVAISAPTSRLGLALRQHPTRVPLRWFAAPRSRQSIADRLVEMGGDAAASVKERLRLFTIKQLGGNTEAVVIEKVIERPVEVVVEKEVVVEREVVKERPVFVDRQVEVEVEKRVEVEVERKVQVHPVFGQLLSTQQARYVYMGTLAQLKNVPVWHRNRTFRKERAEEIAAEQLKDTDGVSSVPGTICVYMDQADNTNIGIVDGQHRVGALNILASAGVWEVDRFNILIEVYPVDSEEEVATLFSDINKAEPVKLIDLPEGSAGEQEKAVYDGAVLEVSSRFAKMFSSSSRCRVPHLNVDSLRSDMFESQLIHRHELHTSEALLTWLLDKNDAMGRRSAEEWVSAVGKVHAGKALQKAAANQFWLGMDRSWMR